MCLRRTWNTTNDFRKLIDHVTIAIAHKGHKRSWNTFCNEYVRPLHAAVFIPVPVTLYFYPTKNSLKCKTTLQYQNTSHGNRPTTPLWKISDTSPLGPVDFQGQGRIEKYSHLH